MLSAPGYSGVMSDHFNGKKFVNPPPPRQEGLFDVLKFMFSSDLDTWRDWTENNDYPVPPERVGAGELRVTFVNHSTLLIQVDSLNILTDPIWSDRAGPFSWAGPKRRRAPGVEFEDLPSIDWVLVSHNHYDHLDLPTLKRLAVDRSVRFITGLGNDLLLKKKGIENVTAIDWGDSIELAEELTLHGVPARHFSNRGMFDNNSTLWMGFVITTPTGSVYFAGDTGLGSHFASLAAQFAPIRLAALPIGAYEPNWFMKAVHTSPAEAVEAHQILEAAVSVAIHFGTFKLAKEGQDQPVEELDEALVEQGLTRDDFWVLDFGEGRDVPPLTR